MQFHLTEKDRFFCSVEKKIKFGSGGCFLKLQSHQLALPHEALSKDSKLNYLPYDDLSQSFHRILKS